MVFSLPQLTFISYSPKLIFNVFSTSLLSSLFLPLSFFFLTYVHWLSIIIHIHAYFSFCRSVNELAISEICKCAVLMTVDPATSPFPHCHPLFLNIFSHHHHKLSILHDTPYTHAYILDPSQALHTMAAIEGEIVSTFLTHFLIVNL